MYIVHCINQSHWDYSQILLNLARGIFVEQYSLENLVKKIMREATDLLLCEQAVVFLRDDHHDTVKCSSEFGPQRTQLNMI